MAKSKEKFEDYLKELENILEKLENEEVALEDALKFYEEGIKLSKKCEKILNDAKQKITVLDPED